MAKSTRIVRTGYHGTAPGASLVGERDCVSSKVLDVLWMGSTYELAEQFQDGEVRKLRATLNRPKIITEEDRRRDWPGLGHAFIVEQIRTVHGNHYDGVIFPDTVDGMEVGDVYAIFSRMNDNGSVSVDHAVKMIGTRWYDEALDSWVSDDGFAAPVPETPNFFKADYSLKNMHKSMEAYVCSKADRDWSDYLDEMGIRSEMVEAILEAPISRIGVLQDITIAEPSRGLGYGSSLLATALNGFEEEKADVVLLLADLEESNAFDLTEWYEKHGFARVDRDKSQPCMMIAPEELISQIRRINGFSIEENMPCL